MIATLRRNKILEMIREEGGARVTRLSEIFGVSEVTIRQDLERLAEDDLIVREHGGAFLKSVGDQVKSLSLANQVNMVQKARIGQRAAELVAPGEMVILDSGTTTTEVARNLSDKSGLTVITNALNIALMLGSVPGIEVLMTGGEFKAPTLSLSGEKAAQFFANVHVDKTFLATAGVSVDGGLTYPGFNDLAVKKAMIDAATKTYLVADSTKVGKRSLATLGSVDIIHGIVTDDAIDDDSRSALENAGLEVLIA